MGQVITSIADVPPGTETLGNADATLGVRTRCAALNVALTAARTVTLPAANVLRAGEGLLVVDIVGGITAANTLTVQRAGSDTINGGTTDVIRSAFAARRYVSNGSSAWYIDRDPEPHPGFVVGSRYGCPYWLSSASAGTVTASRLWGVPIYIPEDRASVTLGVLQSANGAAGTLHRIGLYANLNGIPGSLVSDGGTMAADTGGSVNKTAVITAAIRRGWYWIAIATNSGGNMWRCGGQTSGMDADSGGRSVYQQTAAYTVTTGLPSTFGAGSFVFAGNAVPIVYVQP